MSEVSRVDGRRALCGSFYDPVRASLSVLREHPKSIYVAYQGHRSQANSHGPVEPLIIPKAGSNRLWAWRNGDKVKTAGHDDDLSLLSKNSRFKGALMFEGTARIDGRLQGDISTAGTLIIGEEAVIEGNIVAGTVICVGGVTGDIVASEKVLLIAPAVFKGRVKTPCLSLQEGVSFLGTSEVQNPGLAVPAVSFEGETIESMTMAHGMAWSGELQFQGKRLISTAESGAA